MTPSLLLHEENLQLKPPIPTPLQIITTPPHVTIPQGCDQVCGKYTLHRSHTQISHGPEWRTDTTKQHAYSQVVLA